MSPLQRQFDLCNPTVCWFGQPPELWASLPASTRSPVSLLTPPSPVYLNSSSFCFLPQCNSTTCLYFHWFDHPIPVDLLPESIQLRAALVLSAAESDPTSKSTRLSCANPGCRVKTTGKPRVANQLCTQSAPFCKDCCISSGGCSYEGHKSNGPLPTSDAPTEAPNNTPQPSNPRDPPRTQIRTLARALPDYYGKPFAAAQFANHNRTVQLENQRATNLFGQHIILVHIWTTVRSGIAFGNHSFATDFWNSGWTASDAVSSPKPRHSNLCAQQPRRVSQEK